jgi:hypothetical protein
MLHTNLARGTRKFSASRKRFTNLQIERLEARHMMCCDDLFEPNNSKAEVDLQPPGGLNSPNLGIVTSELILPSLALLDQDWFRLQTTDHGTSHDKLQIDFTNAQGNLDLYLYAENGTTELARSNSNNNTEVVSLADRPAGVYYVKVIGKAGATNAIYSLTYDPPGNSPDDRFEENDSPSAATSIDSVGGTLTGLKLEDRADWFRLQLSDWGTSHDSVKIEFDDAQGDLQLLLYDDADINVENKRKLIKQSISDNDDELLSLADIEPGVYYVLVSGENGAANSNYSLSYDPPGNTPDDIYKNNDSPSAATPIDPAGGTLTGLKLEDHGDWFRLELPDWSTSHDSIKIQFQDAQGDLQLLLYDDENINVENQRRLIRQSISDDDDELLSLADIAPGVYYVLVSGEDGAANPNYSLSYDPPGNSPDDGYENNDSPSLATPINPVGGTLTGLKLEDHADWFRLQLPAWGTTRDSVKIEFDNDQGNLQLFLYEDGNLTNAIRQSVTSNDVESINLADLSPGVYFALVDGREGAANANYSLTYDPPGNSLDDDYEENDSAALVALRIVGDLDSPNLGRVMGSKTIPNLRLEDREDWYRFEIADFPAASHQVRIDFDHSRGNLDLELFAADGTTLLGRSTTSNNANGFERISLEKQLPGLFYIRVSGRSGAANDQYQLTIDAPRVVPRSDLALISDTFVASPSWLAPGSSLCLAAELRNVGQLDSSPVRIAAYLSNDSKIDTTDRLVWQTSLFLQSNQNYLVTEQLVIPPDIAPGNYFLGLLIDEQDAVIEPNEFNNRLSVPITVSRAAPALGEIRGSLFDDENANGTRDAGEVALAGRTVYLDLNANAVRDNGEPLATSDAQGNYAFAGVQPGTYRVMEEPTAGRQPTWPPPAGSDLIYLHDESRLYTVNLQSGLTHQIGSVPFDLADIAFDPRGDLYGVSDTGLYRFNPLTGAATFISGTLNISALTFGPDGTLYAMARFPNTLYTINPTNGQVTELGTVPVGADGDLAFLRGKLFMTGVDDHLYEIDVQTMETVDRGFLRAGDLWGLFATSAGELHVLESNRISAIEDTPVTMRYRRDLFPATGGVRGAARLGESGGLVSGGYSTSVTPGQIVSGLQFAGRIAPFGAGPPGPVVAYIIAPERIRRGREFSFSVEWINESFEDAPAPVLTVGASVPFGRKHNDYSLGMEHTFLGINTQGGPPGILKPGQREKRTFWAYSDTEPGEYTVFIDREIKNASLPFDWESLRPSLIPSGLSAQEFEPIFSQLVRDVGPTSGDYLAMLSRNASLLSGNIHEVENLAALHMLAVNRAWSRVTPSISGSIDGQVGQDLAGLTLLLRDVNSEVLYASLIYKDGSFSFPGLYPGIFELIAPGYVLTGPTGHIVTLGDTPIDRIVLSAVPFDISERLISSGLDEDLALEFEAYFHSAGQDIPSNAMGVDGATIAQLSSESDGIVRAGVHGPNDELRQAAKEGRYSIELALYANFLMEFFQAACLGLSNFTAWQHAVHFLGRFGTPISYEPGSQVSERVRLRDGVVFSHEQAAARVEPIVRQYIESRLARGEELPTSVTFDEMGIGRPQGPNLYVPGGSFGGTEVGTVFAADLALAFGDMSGEHSGEVVSIDTYKTETITSYTATIRYHWRDQYTFVNDINRNIFFVAAYYLEFVADGAKAFDATVTIEERIGGAVEHEEEVKDDKKEIQRPVSVDPNDITGPAGFGPQNHVLASNVMPYTIRFENHPRAEAPAAEVNVTQMLDADLDRTTFQLGDIGFGDTFIDVPDGLTSFHTRVDVTSAHGVFVEISAGFNAVTGEAHWKFVSIDPVTGLPPEDPLVGFLAPNQTAPEGEGFVQYTVRPKSTLVTGDRIDAQASIIFDVNDPILTPPIFHTIDSGLPTGGMQPLAAVMPLVFTVSWAGIDDAAGPTGAGAHRYDVYVSENSGAYSLFKSQTTSTSATFTGVEGHSCRFYAIATDGVGHRQSIPTSFQASTIARVRPWQNPGPTPRHRVDVNDDGNVAADDVLDLINDINAHQSRLLTAPTVTNQPKPYLDVNGDGFVAADDVLAVINHINSFGSGPVGEGEAVAIQSSTSPRFESIPSQSSHENLNFNDLITLLAVDLATQPKRRR